MTVPNEHETSVEIIEAGVTTFRAVCSCGWRTIAPRFDYLTAEIDGATHQAQKAEEELEHNCRVIAYVSSEANRHTIYAAVCQAEGCDFIGSAELDSNAARVWGDAHSELNVPRSVALAQLSDVSFGSDE